MPEIKCTITKNDVLLESVEQTTNIVELYDALEKFETKLNAVMTKMINDAGEPGGDDPVDEESDGTDGEETSDQITVKKMKTT